MEHLQVLPARSLIRVGPNESVVSCVNDLQVELHESGVQRNCRKHEQVRTIRCKCFYLKTLNAGQVLRECTGDRVDQRGFIRSILCLR